MQDFFEHLLASVWNKLHDRRRDTADGAPGLSIGHEVIDGGVSQRRMKLSGVRRTTHLAILGKTGPGKSSLVKHMQAQDIDAGRGFLIMDFHGDTVHHLLRLIARKEAKLGRHLSDRLVLITPDDPDFASGFNPLESERPDFVRIAEFAAILRARWGLDHFGARTDELLRNALFVLSSNGLTLLELAPVLTHSGFRASLLKQVPNPEVK